MFDTAALASRDRREALGSATVLTKGKAATNTLPLVVACVRRHPLQLVPASSAGVASGRARLVGVCANVLAVAVAAVL